MTKGMEETNREKVSLPVSESSTYHLYRLSDQEYRELDKRSLPLATELVGPNLTLAEAYVSCVTMFGARSRHFDGEKGTFAFPLALEVPGSLMKPSYLLCIRDYRGWIEFPMKKILDLDDPRLAAHARLPEQQDFPGHAIIQCLDGLKALLEQTFRKVSDAWKEPFLLEVPIALAISGYGEKGFFEMNFDERDDYEDAVEEHRRQIQKSSETCD